MDKRDIDEQLNDLRFEMDDEIDARNERRGWQPQPVRHAYRPMETSHAIILAAIIIVGGLWGGKLIYDYIQEQRLKAALKEAVVYMDEVFKELDKSSRQMQSDSQRGAALENRAAQQRRAKEDKKRIEEVSKAKQEQKFLSDQCQFWRQQNTQTPNDRNAQKRRESCE